MLALLLALSAQTPQTQHSFRGLARGESVQPLARFEDADEEECVRMRFLDALTSEPLEGVRVEAWTEPGAKPLHLELLVDEAHSARDGSVRVHWRRGEIRGEKLRVSKPGYESQQCGADPGEMLLHPAQPLRGRVLDLERRPIAGATVRSRQSCAHAISASQTRTAEDGTFVLEDFPVSETPELEVFADGFCARGEIDPLVLRQQDLNARARGEFGCTLVLARCVPWRLKLLDASGAPLVRRRVWTTERPVIAQWTDAEGACSFTLPESATSLYLETCDAGTRATYSIPLAPGPAPMLVRALETAPRTPACRVRVDAPQTVEVSALTEDGFVVEGRSGEELLVPRGRARIVVGGASCEWLHEFVIEAGEQPLVLQVPTPVRGATVAFTSSEVGVGDALLAQLGLRTECVVRAEAQDLPIRGSFAGSRPAFALLEANGAVRIARLGPDAEHAADLRTSFREPGCELVPGLANAPIVSVPWQGKSVCPAQAGTVWPALLPCPELANGTPLELPEGRLYYAAFAGRGGVPRHVLRRASAGEDQRIELVRRARLTLEGDVVRVSSFDGDVEPVEKRFVLEPAPGPLFVRVEHRDGTASLLSLVLAPGEQRTLVAE